MKYLSGIGFLLFICLSAFGQEMTNEQIKGLVSELKADNRGPYKDIRWFCKDGTVIMPKEKCPAPGGVQRARYKDVVEKLGKTNHVYFGQILTMTPNEDFWDAKNYNARLKQYQLEKFLRTTDMGWISRKGQYYRGAFQIEDEENWGIEFFHWLLNTDEPLRQQYFLVRQAIKDIPHKGDDNITLRVRAVSKTISDEYPLFMDLRVKIHGQPDASDIENVIAFKEKNKSKMKADQVKKMDELIADMKLMYQPVNQSTLNQHLKKISSELPIHKSLNSYIQFISTEKSNELRAQKTANQLVEIRKEILKTKGKKTRLAMLDISNSLETLLFNELNLWQPKTVKGLTDKINCAALAALGTGYIEFWEWEELKKHLSFETKPNMTIEELFTYLESSRSVLEWGTGMVNGIYRDVVNTYGEFESLAFGFYDDKIRSSVLLQLGNAVGELGTFLAKQSNLTNQVMALSNQSTIRGLNPGFAMGELVVVDKNENEVEISKDKIYVFMRPSSDLKPVAGIMTVSEGNLVSHVQLLARNLGIPNAVLSNTNLKGLKKFEGVNVFYAVSNKGTVIMKPADKMTAAEKKLFEVKKRTEERINVPVEKIDLVQTKILDLRDIDATSSGKICGPKAANLGQLKKMFPDQVVEGLVIPFGIFRSHMNQRMPDHEVSYWQFLRNVFKKAEEMNKNGSSETAIDQYVLQELEVLRNAIKKIKFKEAFVQELKADFQKVLGQPLGKIPVFLRSDTNMEDLKDFSGAGLNLTVFNTVEAAKILQGIKDVWASPFTERSYKWRQRYLLNPENIYPSILIIPSVNVDYSGVLITKGISNGDNRDLTIAFSRGAGGAVDGQAAESYLLYHDGKNELRAPAREPFYRTLPGTGGSIYVPTTFEKPILNEENLQNTRYLAKKIKTTLPNSPGIESKGPFDVEFGFKDNKLWLFQIRPFVENKNAKGSIYLESISPEIPKDQIISINSLL